MRAIDILAETHISLLTIDLCGCSGRFRIDPDDIYIYILLILPPRRVARTLTFTCDGCWALMADPDSRY